MQDSCGGIPQGHLPRVFDVGFRGDAARTPGADAGSGLGLAIVKKIVEEHCGTISFADRPGGGTIVVLCFDTEQLAKLDGGEDPAAMSNSAPAAPVLAQNRT